MRANIISLCVVPVKLHYKYSCRMVKTYALLEDGIQGSFIKDDVLKDLNATGVQTTVAVKTLNGESSSQCEVVHG